MRNFVTGLKSNKMLKSIKHNIKWHLEVNRRYEGYVLRKKIRSDETRVVVFICGYPQGWNSLKSVYEAATGISSIKTYLVAWTGYKYNDIDADSFWKSIDSNVLISQKSNVVNIEKLTPDIIFRQEPYDEVYPEEYSAKNLLKISKLCYIPYAYNSSPDRHLAIEYNDTFFNYCYAIFADNNTVFKYCQEKALRSIFYSNMNFYNYGFPRFDLLNNINESCEYKTFLWIPRWSLDSVGNDKTSFFEYVQKLLKCFESMPHISLIIRPHPGMFKNFIKRGAMTLEDVNEFKNNIEAMPNVCLDEEADYIPSFQMADVLIADYSSLDVEFAVTGKPIIYCGDISQFNEDTKSLADNFYIVSAWDELSKIIEMLIEKRDPKMHSRINAANEFKHSIDGKIGEHIMRKCLTI